MRIAAIDSTWADVEVLALDVASDVPAMPVSDEQLMRGARARADGARASLARQGQLADFYIGLEGGFHSEQLEGASHTFLRGWAYATDGVRSAFGATPSITVPPAIVAAVVDGERELGDVIDEFAGEFDVRSRQGAWGVLSRDLLTRSASFELALLAALAPFYNSRCY